MNCLEIEVPEPTQELIGKTISRFPFSISEGIIAFRLNYLPPLENSQRFLEECQEKKIRPSSVPIYASDNGSLWERRGFFESSILKKIPTNLLPQYGHLMLPQYNRPGILVFHICSFNGNQALQNFRELKEWEQLAEMDYQIYSVRLVQHHVRDTGGIEEDDRPLLNVVLRDENLQSKKLFVAATTYREEDYQKYLSELASFAKEIDHPLKIS